MARNYKVRREPRNGIMSEGHVWLLVLLTTEQTGVPVVSVRLVWSVSDNRRSHHSPLGWVKVVDCVMLSCAVIPDDYRVGSPSKADLIFGYFRLPHQVVQQVICFDREVLPKSNVLVIMKVNEVGSERLVNE